jgi:hypothetical protein
VRFQAEHRFHGPVAAVAALLADPAFYVELALPDLGQPELVEADTDGTEVVVRLRYEFVGNLDPIVHRLLGSSRLTWIQEVRVDRQAGSGSLRFEAEKDPRRLHGAAQFTLTGEGNETVRRIDGELVVAIVGIGGMAERRIVPGLLQRMDIEAEALESRLRPE